MGYYYDYFKSHEVIKTKEECLSVAEVLSQLDFQVSSFTLFITEQV
jgi:hypothetical protein